MNISKPEQRVLHVLAQRGLIRHERDHRAKVVAVTCFTHDGNVLSDCTLAVFTRLRAKRLIRSRNGASYRITRLGRTSVRAQADNRS
ncbi:YjhX family toxin [Pontivivens ytuae]|uniref:UPF0386 protein I0K15_05415 n=1 Tax=Pontivivens ytuae TaxID=2789856 RepID=A0A7S9LTV8_9RHOB|nr:YjhX family toxin [Pontivivens ytuae]QPH55179.1 YjhX family toxin [Pontivivens ytuae]